MKGPDVTVQIMAGGKSTRMGADKAAVMLAGRTLLDRGVETWRGWGAALFISVGGPERRELAPTGTVPVYDRYLHCGPLGGLHGGLAVCQTELLLLCAVDAPCLGPAHAQALVEAIGTADACVYTLEGRPQPLFGLYRGTCLPVAEEMLQTGNHRMRDLLARMDTVLVPATDPAAFQNLNTPAQLAEMEQIYLSSEK